MLLLVITVLIGIALYGFFIEPNELFKTDLTLTFEGLKKQIKIVQISDLHSTGVSRPLKKSLEIIQKESPDFVFITGDFVSYKKRLLCKNYLMEIVRVCPNTYAVLGNWDHKADDFQELIRQIKETGVKLLVNDACFTNGIFIAGVDDPYRNMDDLQRTYKDIPTKSFVILLSHSPDIIERALPYNPKLILAGHLHGGQIALPIVKFALYVPSKYWVKFLRGLYKSNGTYMYVNRGIGESHLRIRICSPPEIAVIKLNL
jgi:predicted MPP superfamily phosphohydrolase